MVYCLHLTRDNNLTKSTKNPVPSESEFHILIYCAKNHSTAVKAKTNELIYFYGHMLHFGGKITYSDGRYDNLSPWPVYLMCLISRYRYIPHFTIKLSRSHLTIHSRSQFTILSLIQRARNHR